MIISRTPFRVSFLGGGTDLRSFYKDNPAGVISTSIDKYIYISMHNYFHPSRFLLKYSKTEEVGSVDDIEHAIIREVFKRFNIINIDFNSTADIPAGTGMGSSSAFTNGLVNACSIMNGNKLAPHEIAKIACEIEIDILKEPIGKQDQYGTAIGGFKRIQFNPEETVDVTPIFLDREKLLDLQNNLMLFHTNKTRAASSILAEQNQNTQTSKKVIGNLKSMYSLVDQLFQDLKNQNIDSFGHYLHQSWEYKKELASNISNGFIDELYSTAMRNGAEGGKLLGAGSSGFLLLYVPKDMHETVRRALSHCRELPFNFEDEGTKIIFNNSVAK
jgi:D-glycero-alpha-D-manno-heptose-7-phosphate kinase